MSEILEAFESRGLVSMTSEGFIDAEKFSNRINSNTGTWITTDGYRESGNWGDSQMCWAGSAANMLRMSGWYTKGVNPYTGETFADEDEVFTYLIESFENKGGFQYDGIQWFFEGKVSEEAKPLSENGTAFVKGKNYKNYTSNVSLNTEHEEYGTLEEGLALFEVLKEGGAVGIGVDFDPKYYTLKDDPYTMVVYNENTGRYESREKIFTSSDDENLEEHFYTYDSDGNVLILYEDGETYKDETGKVYDPISVMYDKLIFSDDGYYYKVDKIISSVFYTVKVPHEIDEIDFSKEPEITNISDGEHAITVCGYIINTSCDNIEDRLCSIFISDSDDDSKIYAIDENTLSREERPNTYRMLPVTYRSLSNAETFEIEGYMNEYYTTISFITSLKSCN